MQLDEDPLIHWTKDGILGLLECDRHIFAAASGSTRNVLHGRFPPQTHSVQIRNTTDARSVLLNVILRWRAFARADRERQLFFLLTAETFMAYALELLLACKELPGRALRRISPAHLFKLQAAIDSLATFLKQFLVPRALMRDRVGLQCKGGCHGSALKILASLLNPIFIRRTKGQNFHTTTQTIRDIHRAFGTQEGINTLDTSDPFNVVVDVVSGTFRHPPKEITSVLTEGFRRTSSMPLRCCVYRPIKMMRRSRQKNSDVGGKVSHRRHVTRLSNPAGSSQRIKSIPASVREYISAPSAIRTR